MEGNNSIQGKELNGSASTRKRRGSQGNYIIFFYITYFLGANINLAADFPPLPSAAFEQSKTRYTTGKIENCSVTDYRFHKILEKRFG